MPDAAPETCTTARRCAEVGTMALAHPSLRFEGAEPDGGGPRTAEGNRSVRGSDNQVEALAALRGIG